MVGIAAHLVGEFHELAVNTVAQQLVDEFRRPARRVAHDDALDGRTGGERPLEGAVGQQLDQRLLAVLGGDPTRVLTASREELLQVQGVGPVIADTLRGWAAHFDLSAEEERIRRSGTEFVVAADPTYPRLLREVNDPPIGLYRRGTTPAGQRCIAIVGSRRTTQYGLEVARTFAAGLTRAGFCIVSVTTEPSRDSSNSAATETRSVVMTSLRGRTHRSCRHSRCDRRRP